MEDDLELEEEQLVLTSKLFTRPANIKFEHDDERDLDDDLPSKDDTNLLELCKLL